MTHKADTKRSLIRNQQGLTTVEYIILLGLVAVFGIGAWTTFGKTLSEEVKAADTRMDVVR